MKKIVLTAINAKYIHSNLAVYSLKANAGKYEKEIELAEYTINHQKEDILAGIYMKKPDIVGFSCYIWNIEYILDVAENLKKICPQVEIIFGGPEVSYDAEKILEKYSFVDLVMAGEGEVTFREYAAYAQGESGAELADVAGLCYRGEDGKAVFTAPRKPMKMDDLVFPYRELDQMENRIIYYETIRGCPFSCSYCLSSIDKTVRLRSLDLVFGELDFFLKNRVKQVKFVDRTFNCNHDHAYKIWKYIKEHDNGVTNFHFEIGGDLLREEDFELFKEFRPGLIQFEIGVQSTNLSTIEAIRRKMDLTELAEHVARVRSGENIHQHLDLIAGLPHEDFASFHKSFNDVYRMRPDQFQLGFLKVLKGSYMEEVKEEYEIRYRSRPPYEVLATKWLSYGDVLRLKRVEEMVEVHYNSFQFQATMLALGSFYPDAFEMYEAMGDFYEKKGYFGLKHSRIARYEILWEFIGEAGLSEEAQGILRETLSYDMYARDYVKNPPAFVLPRSHEYQRKVREFLAQESEQPAVLSGYAKYQPKQLFNMIYMQQFTVDIPQLLKNGKISHCGEYSLLFDYKKRNPLTHSADVIRI
ncbi:MAG TPA: B12-binding domain-containing radical SAM protein [Lachnospiraceae bacterium]|nr:B12-binding domain-containing radical SAM protein [Lachnospiraceae bacterium]